MTKGKWKTNDKGHGKEDRPSLFLSTTSSHLNLLLYNNFMKPVHKDYGEINTFVQLSFPIFKLISWIKFLKSWHFHINNVSLAHTTSPND